MLADAAVNRLRHDSFQFEFEGEAFIEQLGRAEGGIVLTAHMGNYDLGAATFARKFNRHLRMVRAAERDLFSARHLDVALHDSGAVKVNYSDQGPSLAFDLLNALRNHETISIQGDRLVGTLASAPVRFFGRDILFPAGPFVLAFAAAMPIYPLFVVRAGFRRYRIVAFQPIRVAGEHKARDEQVARAMQIWTDILEQMVRQNWSQWYSFRPLF
jgi:lauroyl/myristoyl acyltransferase